LSLVGAKTLEVGQRGVRLSAEVHDGLWRRQGSDRVVLVGFSGSIPEIIRESWGKERDEFLIGNRRSFYPWLRRVADNSTARIMILAPHKETAEFWDAMFP
jgi:hypothetical protein